MAIEQFNINGKNSIVPQESYDSVIRGAFENLKISVLYKGVCICVVCKYVHTYIHIFIHDAEDSD